MPKHRKRAVIVEAEQFTEKNKHKVVTFVQSNCVADFENGQPILKIQTIHGNTTYVRLGDWVVKSRVSGDYWVITPLDISATTYEFVED